MRRLWATTKPLLTAPTLSVGLYFLAAAYKAEGHESHQHLILDTISNRLFREEDVSRSAIYLLKNKVDAFKKDWDGLNPTPPAPAEAPTRQPSVPK
jgi:hypothetical protein